MVKSGFGLNIIGIALTVVVTYLLVLPMFGVVLNEVPAWAQLVVK
jgi:sodium-dependent dicarboxylate transporter 2/3/5